MTAQDLAGLDTATLKNLLGTSIQETQAIRKMGVQSLINQKIQENRIRAEKEAETIAARRKEKSETKAFERQKELFGVKGVIEEKIIGKKGEVQKEAIEKKFEGTKELKLIDDKLQRDLASQSQQFKLDLSAMDNLFKASMKQADIEGKKELSTMNNEFKKILADKNDKLQRDLADLSINFKKDIAILETDTQKQIAFQKFENQKEMFFKKADLQRELLVKKANLVRETNRLEIEQKAKFGFINKIRGAKTDEELENIRKSIGLKEVGIEAKKVGIEEDVLRLQNMLSKGSPDYIGNKPEVAKPIIKDLNLNKNLPFYYIQLPNPPGWRSASTKALSLPVINGEQVLMQDVREIAKKQGISIEETLTHPSLNVLVKDIEGNYAPAK